jgi:hypothetical protein
VYQERLDLSGCQHLEFLRAAWTFRLAATRPTGLILSLTEGPDMPRNSKPDPRLSVLSTVLLFRPVVSLVVQDYFPGFALIAVICSEGGGSEAKASASGADGCPKDVWVWVS